jgi:hypothetical protein
MIRIVVPPAGELLNDGSITIDVVRSMLLGFGILFCSLSLHQDKQPFTIYIFVLNETLNKTAQRPDPTTIVAFRNRIQLQSWQEQTSTSDKLVVA